MSNTSVPRRKFFWPLKHATFLTVLLALAFIWTSTLWHDFAAGKLLLPSPDAIKQSSTGAKPSNVFTHLHSPLAEGRSICFETFCLNLQFVIALRAIAGFILRSFAWSDAAQSFQIEQCARKVRTVPLYVLKCSFLL